MGMYLNYSQDKEKMVRQFKFFHGITIEAEGIQGIVRTLRARWEPETINELNAYHAIDAEAELINILSQEFANEIDMEVVRILNDEVERINDPILDENFQRPEINEMIDDIDTNIRRLTRHWNGGHRA